MSDARAKRKIRLDLYQAIKEGNAGSVASLLPQIAINEPITDTGMTTFAFACSQTQDASILQTIVNLNPDWNALDSVGRTPLHHAAIKSNIACIDIFAMVNQQAPGLVLVNAQTSGRETPLMFAVRSGHLEVVAKLLNLTANPFILNGMGQSAIDLAQIHHPILV
jgi:ankyrin repeat protein